VRKGAKQNKQPDVATNVHRVQRNLRRDGHDKKYFLGDLCAFARDIRCGFCSRRMRKDAKQNKQPVVATNVHRMQLNHAP